MRALNRNVERVFNPNRKDHHWGRRKLAKGSMIEHARPGPRGIARSVADGRVWIGPRRSEATTGRRCAAHGGRDERGPAATAAAYRSDRHAMTIPTTTIASAISIQFWAGTPKIVNCLTSQSPIRASPLDARLRSCADAGSNEPKQKNCFAKWVTGTQSKLFGFLPTRRATLPRSTPPAAASNLGPLRPPLWKTPPTGLFRPLNNLCAPVNNSAG
jgi:hypothetical protein